MRSAGRSSSRCAPEAELTFSLNYGWTGKQQTHPGGIVDPVSKGCAAGAGANFLDSRYELEDYGLLNGRVRYTSADGQWALTLFGNNLTDEVYANYASRFGGGFWDSGNPAAPFAAPPRSALAHHARPAARVTASRSSTTLGGMAQGPDKGSWRRANGRAGAQAPAFSFGGHGWPTCSKRRSNLLPARAPRARARRRRRAPRACRTRRRAAGISCRSPASR